MAQPIVACEPDAGVVGDAGAADASIDAGDAGVESDGGDADVLGDGALEADGDAAPDGDASADAEADAEADAGADAEADAAAAPEEDAAVAPDAEPLPPPPLPTRPETGSFGAVPECNEDNNVLLLEIADPSPQVDLALSDFTTEDARCPIARLSVTVSNIGAVASGDALLRFFAGDPRTGGYLLFEDRLPGPIEPGHDHLYQADVPAFQVYQPIRVYATLHSVDGAAECSLHDNQLAASTLVRCRRR